MAGHEVDQKASWPPGADRCAALASAVARHVAAALVAPETFATERDDGAACAIIAVVRRATRAVVGPHRPHRRRNGGAPG